MKFMQMWKKCKGKKIQSLHKIWKTVYVTSSKKYEQATRMCACERERF